MGGHVGELIHLGVLGRWFSWVGVSEGWFSWVGVSGRWFIWGCWGDGSAGGVGEMVHLGGRCQEDGALVKALADQVWELEFGPT